MVIQKPNTRMKHLRALIVALCFLCTSVLATPVTLTIVINSPGQGTVTGGGTQDSSIPFNIQIQAAPGFYISNSVIGTVMTSHFGDTWRMTFMSTPYGSIADFTVITNDTESLPITTDETLTVTFAPCRPMFYLQPTSQPPVVTGSSVTMSGFAYGRQPMLCQWYKDGQIVPTATSSNLVISSAQPTNSGTYVLWATNSFGVTNSMPANLLVEDIVVSLNGRPITNSTIITGVGGTIGIQSLYPNGTIFYTLDGSAPDFSSSLYSGPILIEGPGTLRVIAYSSDFMQSDSAGPVSIATVPSYNLHISSTGGGTFVRSPFPDSAYGYQSNAVVTVSAVPYSGWTFLGWAGALTGDAPTNTIVMNGQRTVRGYFGTPLNTTVAGNGTVLKIPDLPRYAAGMTVRLTAVPAAGSYFGVWGNAASGNQNPVEVQVNNANMTVSALFAALPANQVTLTTLATGGGTVRLSPATNRFAVGTAITLTAYPDNFERFLGWSGDASGTANPLNITMDQSKTVTATFSRDATLQISSVHPFGFSAFGNPGDTFEFQSSTNLVNWQSIQTITNYESSTPFLDLTDDQTKSKMYRVIVH